LRLHFWLLLSFLLPGFLRPISLYAGCTFNEVLGEPKDRPALRRDLRFTGSIALILIHGNHAEEDRACGGWANFLDLAAGNVEFTSKYRVYVFLHNTSKPIGFDGTGNAEDLGNLIANESTLNPIESIGLIAHSRGGLVARAYMNKYRGGTQGGRVFVLLTLGTPHHGSPAAVPDWGLLTIKQYYSPDSACLSNLYYNTTEAADTSLCKVKLEGILGPETEIRSRPIFDVTRPGNIDLGYDNYDGSATGIPFEPDFKLKVSGKHGLLALPNPHTLSVMDANGVFQLPANEHDNDLHGTDPRFDPPGSLDELNRTDKWLHRIIAYGGYYSRPKDNNTFRRIIWLYLTRQLADPGVRNHALLSHSGRILHEFRSKNSRVGLFAANDGLVPLQSALLLKPSSSLEPLYDIASAEDKEGAVRIVYPLQLKDLAARTLAGKVRWSIFPITITSTCVIKRLALSRVTLILPYNRFQGMERSQ
jgi:PGAP1-like protein